MSVLLDTTHGPITIDLFTASAPRACLNFLKLCKLHAYRGCLFFNVQPSFAAQTGDPTGTGRGGTSVFGMLYGEQARYFEPEVRPHLRHAKRGTVSLVPAPGGGNASQFLITLADGCSSLDARHTVFGEVVTEGGAWPTALAALNASLCDDAGRPYADARVLQAHVLVDPFEDPPGFAALQQQQQQQWGGGGAAAAQLGACRQQRLLRPGLAWRRRRQRRRKRKRLQRARC